MKIQDLVIESLLFEIRLEVRRVLAESISDYFSQFLSKVKHGDDPSDKELEQISALVAGMKVLSIPQYRQAITKDDIGVNPNSAKELFDLLNGIPRDGKLNTLTVKVFDSLKTIAPSIFKKELEEITAMRGATKQERDAIIAKLNVFATKVGQSFNKAKTAASSEASAPGVTA